jgi:hypothetical protein
VFLHLLEGGAMKRILAGLGLAFALVAAHAQEGRAFNPIARPAARPALPDGAVRMSPPIPVTREQVARAVNRVAEAWGNRQLDQLLSPQFRDREKLVDAIETRVPRDASLRVTAIQGWQVLDQYRKDGALVSRVSVTVRTQVEFNDAATGFQARDGTNEYVMTLTDRGSGR